MHRMLCYDVSADRRRTRLFRRLKRYLVPVQQSVFEGHLPAALLPRLLAMVEREIEPAEDTVRLYSLCPRCAARVRTIGVATPLPDPDEPIIIR